MFININRLSSVKYFSNVTKTIQIRSITTLSGDDYNYIHKSKLPTLKFQKSLPRLPIPKLEDTIRRYLSAAEAVLPEVEYKILYQLTKEFEASEGKELQELLLQHDKANKHTSYISEPWFDMYLSSRLPCPVNFNPFMMYSPDKDTTQNDQLTRATNFVISFGRIKKALDKGCLDPEVFFMKPDVKDSKLYNNLVKASPDFISWYVGYFFKAFALDMSQYGNLFGSTRIPEIGKDRLFLDKKSNFFVVAKGGNFFKVQLFDDCGNILPPQVIQASIAKILENTLEVSSDCAVGSLTCADRDTWAKARKNLEKSPLSASSLALIDSSLFLLCLDDIKTTDHQRLIQSLLIGDNGANRWFDKCFSCIVDKNGHTSINFEHSWGDGVAVLRLMNESKKDVELNRFVTSTDSVDTSINVEKYIKKLEFSLSDEDKETIKNVQNQHLALANKLEFGTVEYVKMNKNLLKKFKVSPDSIMQLAIQLAYYKMYKQFVPTYESASTAAFLKGRTECVRSATKETKNVVLAINQDKGNISELIRKASAVHYLLCKEAAMGQGVDRHLLGLKIAAEKFNKPIPEFYDHDIVKYLNHYVLSTSTLSSDTIIFGGFGPVVPDGFGIGYNVTGDKIGAVISSYKNKKNAQEFANSLYKSLDEIKFYLTRET
ncbi:Carnitine O-palmitoyltransferase 2,mitochondrial [Strongyloides ratti]|uniref:Carnitine O-palmitoyltransferase 2,mitochondrial n=1 Tax=Strongyloides ratti TaxID=34506 RepID=A0A090KZV2_STRRB|nr:Carnitine O-palmitoyltransferase 2,mitochondrial [Strongyloides ratti]CEF60719.1 Carnitine O-palmitoyltransferase 2,mitochondrial [Strongyloides ratti]